MIDKQKAGEGESLGSGSREHWWRLRSVSARTRIGISVIHSVSLQFVIP